MKDDCVVIEKVSAAVGFVLLDQTVYGEAIYLERGLVCINGSIFVPAFDYPCPEFPGLEEEVEA